MDATKTPVLSMIDRYEDLRYRAQEAKAANNMDEHNRLMVEAGKLNDDIQAEIWAAE